MADNPIFAFAGAYAFEEDARADFETIKDAHLAGLIGKYDSALFTKKGDGKVKVLNTDSTTRTSGAKWGLATGAVVGLLFPPTLIAGLVWGGGIGTLVGHFAKGWATATSRRSAMHSRSGSRVSCWSPRRLPTSPCFRSSRTRPRPPRRRSTTTPRRSASHLTAENTCTSLQETGRRTASGTSLSGFAAGTFGGPLPLLPRQTAVDLDLEGEAEKRPDEDDHTEG